MQPIQFLQPDITAREIRAVQSVLQSGWLTTGPVTARLEEGVARWAGQPRALCLSSATAGLELALRFFGVGPGDEVVTTAYTYSATAAAIAHCGARIVLCDLAPGSYEMDLQQLERLIGPDTRAVIPVDIGGVACDYARLYALLEGKGAVFAPKSSVQQALGRPLLLADAAHAFGASREGVPCGSLADMTVFSFHAVKNLTTCEGGALTWRADLFPPQETYRTLSLLSLHGQSKTALEKSSAGGWEYDILELGYKYNMTDLHAAVGLSQLERYPAMLEARHRLAARYDRLLGPAGVPTLAHRGRDFVSSCHLYMVQLPGASRRQRDRVIGEMARRGISCNVHYKPLPAMTAYQRLGFRPGDFPRAQARFEGEVTLPLHTKMQPEDADRAALAFMACLRKEKLL